MRPLSQIDPVRLIWNPESHGTILAPSVVQRQPDESTDPTRNLPISIPMPWAVLKASLPFLAVLMYVLVNAVLTVLASQRRHAIELHDRIREARLLRQGYIDSIEEKSNGATEPY